MSNFIVGDPDTEDHTHFYIRGHPLCKTSNTLGHNHVVAEGLSEAFYASASGEPAHVHSKFTPFDNQGEQ